MSDKIEKSSDVDDLEVDVDDDSPNFVSDQQPISIRNLVVVAMLNIVCMAFIVYHFKTTQHHSAMASDRPDPGVERLEDSFPLHPKPVTEDHAAGAVDSPLSIRGQGNVGFGAMTINIASFVPGIDVISTDRPDEDGAWKDEGRSLAETPIGRIDTEGDQWVQLGALSRTSTAREYWKKLQSNHEALLQPWTPRYVGPEEVGGSLYHLRIGPMAASAATKLCNDLKADGAECFCINN